MPGAATNLMRPGIEVVAGGRDGLGESPVWDAAAGRLFWADALAPRVRALDPATGESWAWAVPSAIGSIALGARGRLLMALEDGLYGLDLGNGAVGPVWTTALPAATRFNDGKADRDGGFVFGTMQVEDEAAPGFLARLRADGGVERLAEGFGVTNAVCFSPDGATLYAADSRQGVIWAWDYAPAAPLGPRRVLADVQRMTGSGPDGATVDAEGFLWVALVRTGQLGRFGPDGALEQVIDLPVRHPTCPAFGGPGRATLFVTSISRSRRLRADGDADGRLLAISGLGVTGLAERRVEHSFSTRTMQ